MTAVFGMRYVPGFEREIVAALESENPGVHYEAVCAAGVWSVEAAWPHVVALVTAENVDKFLRLAAIDAVASIRPKDAAEILGDLLDSTDEDIRGRCPTEARVRAREMGRSLRSVSGTRQNGLLVVGRAGPSGSDRGAGR